MQSFLFEKIRERQSERKRERWRQIYEREREIKNIGTGKIIIQ